MQFRIFLLAFILVNISFAQLTVEKDSYLFAKDVVLFVEDDVNLKEETAHLYLRNESQLIQGSGTTGNSGVGKLSIQQTGTVNTYAYNYWCSPVGNTDADDSDNREFIPKKNIYYETTAPKQVV